MKKSYRIDGMSCMNCVQHVEDALKSFDGIRSVEVQLAFPQLTLQGDVIPGLDVLDKAVGKYSISELEPLTMEEASEPTLRTYKPLVLVVLFITGIAIAVQTPFDSFSWPEFMRHFMAGFFLAFSFFKFLDLSGFARSFAMYDIIASRWNAYGFIYPFLELLLGLLYLIGWASPILHLAVIIVLGLGTVGVIQSNLQKRKIQCACLGTVFNLPMSQVTIIENVSMILMALAMILI